MTVTQLWYPQASRNIHSSKLPSKRHQLERNIPSYELPNIECVTSLASNLFYLTLYLLAYKLSTPSDFKNTVETQRGIFLRGPPLLIFQCFARGRQLNKSKWNSELIYYHFPKTWGLNRWCLRLLFISKTVWFYNHVFPGLALCHFSLLLFPEIYNYGNNIKGKILCL